MIPLIIALYVSGCVVGYLLVRLSVKKQFKGWTKGDRAFAMFSCLTSWLCACVALLQILEEETNNDKSAKW